MKNHSKLAKNHVKSQIQKFREEVNGVRSKLMEIIAEYPGLFLSKLDTRYYDNSEDDDDHYTFKVCNIDFRIFSRRSPIPIGNYNETGIIEFSFWPSGTVDIVILSKSNTIFELEQKSRSYKAISQRKLFSSLRREIKYALKINKERFE